MEKPIFSSVGTVEISKSDVFGKDLVDFSDLVNLSIGTVEISKSDVFGKDWPDFSLFGPFRQSG